MKHIKILDNLTQLQNFKGFDEEEIDHGCFKNIKAQN